MSATRFIESAKLGSIFKPSRLIVTASRLMQLEKISKYSRRLTMLEFARLIYVLLASGKPANIFRVVDAVELVKSNLTGITLFEWFLKQMEGPELFRHVSHIVFSTGAYGEVHYYDGRTETFGKRQGYCLLRSVDHSTLYKILIEWERYQKDELTVQYGQNEA